MLNMHNLTYSNDNNKPVKKVEEKDEKKGDKDPLQQEQSLNHWLYSFTKRKKKKDFLHVILLA